MTAIRVLLVEDNPADADLLRESLEESELPVEMSVASTGADAWRVLARCLESGDPLPDLILLDLNMPGMSGREVLARVRSEDRLRRCPVVILTSSSAEQDIVQSYELGANCYVVKPLEFSEYMSVMQVLESFWLRIVKLPSLART